MIILKNGDCSEVLKTIENDSIDLIITSPPYSDARKNTYSSIHPDKYVEWFIPITQELLRVLKPSGTFILNIKEKVVSGQRHTYVIELILEMKKHGWLWTEEFCWCKKNSAPGYWPNRLRDSWERLLQFNKQREFAMYQDAVKIPIGDWAKPRLKNLSETDKSRHNSETKSGFGRNMQNWVGKEMVLPSNVLHAATECGNKKHSAAFPKAIPEWFINLFTKENDTVLDPFVGSGTTLEVCQKMNRNGIGIEISNQYCEEIRKNLFTTQSNIHISEK